MGIKVKFKCNLVSTYSSIQKGNYGLKIIYTYRDDNNEIKLIEDRFDVMDMIGTPYAFADFSLQEKLIDISSLGNIIKIDIELF
jgi:hypothetical protein